MAELVVEGNAKTVDISAFGPARLPLLARDAIGA
jgi:hypothetical protein